MTSYIFCVKLKILFAILTLTGLKNYSIAQNFSDVSVLIANHLPSSETPAVITVYKSINQDVKIYKAGLQPGSLSEQYMDFSRHDRTDRISSNDNFASLHLDGPVLSQVGVYTVTVMQDGKETEMRILILNSAALITAREYSTVVSLNEPVTLFANYMGGIEKSALRWRRDGVFQGSPCYETDSCDALKPGVWECFSAGNYGAQEHAIMNLIIRGCSEGWWGSNCTKMCPHCFNGGICSNTTGLCQCPPGFSGTHCEQVHGRNIFGQLGEHKCNVTGDEHSEGCKGSLICYPNPLGCMCPAGYSGLDCNEECEDGKFGSNCKQTCHCPENVTCAKDTGVCEDSQCGVGWKGINCQVEDPCEIGMYGDLCLKECSCPEGNCLEVEKNCERGCAEPWTGLACDQDGPGTINITYMRVNPNAKTNVTCSIVTNPVTSESDLQLSVGNTVVMDTLNTHVNNRSYIRSNTWEVTFETTTTATCSVDNTMSQLELEPYVLPRYKDDINPLTVAEFNSTYIKITWRAWREGFDVGDGPVVDYRMRYRPSGQSSWSDQIPTEGNVEAEFTTLTPDTEYDFQMRVVREGRRGAGVFNGIISQKTACGVPSERPQLNLTSQATPRSAQFLVQIPSKNTWNCRSLTAVLHRRSSDGTLWELEIENDTDSTSVEVTGLIPCSSYSFWIRIFNDAGSQFSDVVNVETTPEALGEVRDFQVVTSDNQGQLDISWNETNVSQNNCPIDSYTVKYRLTEYVGCSANAGVEMERAETTSEMSHILRGLEDYAYYEVKVHANGRINGTESMQIGQTTEGVPSGAPRNVELRRNESNCSRFAWDRPECESRNGEIIRYFYSLSQRDGTIVEEDYYGERSRLDIKNLTPYTEYSFVVLALTSVGPGPYSAPLAYRTAEDRPPKLLQPVSPFANRSVIAVQWSVPNPPHGIIRNYEISYGRSNEGDQVINVTTNIAGDPPSYVLTGLDSSANYTVRVRAYTTVGPGPYSDSLEQITKEGLPDAPVNVNVSERALDGLTIEWNIPYKPKGKITKYEVQYKAIARPYLREVPEEEADTVDINNPKEFNSYKISGLDPSTIYEIQVAAFTSAGKGDSATINGTTAIFRELEAVDVAQVATTREETSARVTLPALTQEYATGYRIRIKSLQNKKKRIVSTFEGYDENRDDYITAELDKEDDETPFTVGDGKIYGGYNNAPLDRDKKYEMYIHTLSKVGGEFAEVSSEPIQLYDESSGAAALIVILILLFVIIILLGGIIWWKRRDLKNWKDDLLQGKKGREEDGVVMPKVVELEMNPSESLDNLANQEYNQTSPKGRHSLKKKSLKKMQKGVKIADLAMYVMKKKTSEKDNFETEYEMLPQGQLYPWDVASKPENKTKNRYGNIIPYDDSRVILPLIDGKPHSDYINASYIDGYQHPNKYIACHGANKASVLDFWRMVWLENCGKIVMLTNLSEGGKKKCEKYWPDDAMKYGDLKIVCTSTDTYPTCTVRTFALNKMNDEASVKHVRHFHFTAWPDMKVPDFAGPLLDFLQLIRDDKPYQDGPVVVHCSAGVGRTGTYITLDAMLDMANAEGRVNVFQFVSQMRERRIKMVQVVEQYQFIFDALVEYFVVGNTSIQMETFRTDLMKLKDINNSTHKSYLQEQYETLQLITVTPPEGKFAGGRKPENRKKNRFQDCLPVDSYRPYLMTDVGSLGNNYINASFVDGLQKKNRFLATQMPLETTILDFWRLVWDYNSPAIVMLNEMNMDLVQYWPESGTYECDPFTITILSCNDHQGIRCRMLEIANPTQTIECPKRVMHLQLLDWPEDTNAPISPQTLPQAINMLTQWTIDCDKGPTIVHCINGIGRTAVFCGVMNALEQIKLEGKADIFQLVNKMRNCRPNMVKTFEQYQLIFDIVLAHLEEETIYENYSK